MIKFNWINILRYKGICKMVTKEKKKTIRNFFNPESRKTEELNKTHDMMKINTLFLKYGTKEKGLEDLITKKNKCSDEIEFLTRICKEISDKITPATITLELGIALLKTADEPNKEHLNFYLRHLLHDCVKTYNNELLSIQKNCRIQQIKIQNSEVTKKETYHNLMIQFAEIKEFFALDNQINEFNAKNDANNLHEIIYFENINKVLENFGNTMTDYNKFEAKMTEFEKLFNNSKYKIGVELKTPELEEKVELLYPNINQEISDTVIADKEEKHSTLNAEIIKR